MKVFLCLVVFVAAAHAAIDVIAPGKAFVAGGESVSSPVIEDVPTGDLQQLLLNDTALYIMKVVDNINREMTILAHSYAVSVDNYRQNYERSIQLISIGDEAEAHLDFALGLLNDRIQGAVSLIPQNFGGDAVSAELPTVTEETSTNSPRDEENTLHDLINNAPIVLDAAVKTLVDFQKEVLNAGSAGIIDSYPELHKQFSTAACADYLLPAIRSAVITVVAHETVTREHVEPETWAKFEELAKRVYGLEITQ